MKTATIDLRALAAISQVVGKEETRFYLKGVCVEITPDHVTYIATDGHVLAATRRKQEGEAVEPLEGRYIIPTHICTHFKLPKREEYVWATLQHNEGLSFTLRYAEQAITFEVVDGTFPDWRRVVPSECDGVVAQFNPMILARLSKVSKTLCRHGKSEQVQLAHNGYGPALATFNCEDENAFGVIMPFRQSRTPELPEWFKEKPEALPMAAE